MLYTSAEANKLLRSLKEMEATEKAKEQENKTFEAALGEDISDVRPDYDFLKTCQRLEELQDKIRTVKHAINVFNATTVIIDDLTIDMVLILLPQLTDRKRTLFGMKMTPAKKRQKAYGMGSASVIDYEYANFDPEEVEKEHLRISKRIDEIQLALDQANMTKKFEIDI